MIVAPVLPSSVRRSFDAAFFNALANDPEVRPYLGGEGELDLRAAVENPINFALRTEGGGFLLICQDVGLYEVHTMFPPKERGKYAVRAMRDGFRYMFTRTDATVIRSRFPHANERAAAFGKLAGFHMLFEGQDERFGPTSYGVVTLDQWVGRDRELDLVGEWFHGALEDAKTASGSTRPVHAHDPIHERAVGAAALMCLAGNAEKAVLTYNRWAVFVGYEPLALINTHPPTIDLLDAVVEVGANSMEIIKCQQQQ